MYWIQNWITLTVEQREKYAPIGDGYENWIDDCYTGMQEIPKSVPDYISVTEISKDIVAKKVLNNWESQLKGIFEMVRDSNLIVGSDLRQNSLMYYGYAKVIEGQVPGLKALVEKLSVFFKKTFKRKAPTT